METPDLFSLFVGPLHRAGLRYMISGSLATVHHGEPRLTMDVDLVVHLEPPETAGLPAVFPAEHYYLPPPDVMAAEVARPTLFQTRSAPVSDVRIATDARVAAAAKAFTDVVVQFRSSSVPCCLKHPSA